MKSNIKSLAKMTALLIATAVTVSFTSGLTAYAGEYDERIEEYYEAHRIGTPYRLAEMPEDAYNTAGVADTTKLDLIGNYIIGWDHNGSPEPQLTKNEDGTYTLIMYVGQVLILPMNNPWAEEYENPVIINNNVVSCIYNAPAEPVEEGGTTDLDSDSLRSIRIQGECEGSAVLELGIIEYHDEDSDDFNVISNTVMVGVFVLQSVPGAQERVLTQSEVESEGWDLSEEGRKFRENVFRINDHHEQHHVVKVYKHENGSVTQVWDDGSISFSGGLG